MDIIQLLGQTHRVRFRRLPPRILGLCEFDVRVISIDISKGSNPARTYLHELIHLWDSELSEKRVLRKEYRLWLRLTAGQKILVYSCLFAGKKIRDKMREMAQREDPK